MIKYDMHNGLEIEVEIEPEDASDGFDRSSFYLEWDPDPAEFAAQLREAADFIEYWAARKIFINVD